MQGGEHVFEFDDEFFAAFAGHCGDHLHRELVLGESLHGLFDIEVGFVDGDDALLLGERGVKQLKLFTKLLIFFVSVVFKSIDDKQQCVRALNVF